MPYKVVHVFSEAKAEFLNENKSCVDYDDLSELLEDGWEIEDTQSTAYKGQECERYRLKKGDEERGLTQRQADVSAAPPQRGVYLPGDAGLMPTSGSMVAQLAQAMGQAFHHLGPSQAGALGVPVVSGNSSALISQHAADAVYRLDDEGQCPFKESDIGYDYWMDGFEQARQQWEHEHGRRHPSH